MNRLHCSAFVKQQEEYVGRCTTVPEMRGEIVDTPRSSRGLAAEMSLRVPRVPDPAQRWPSDHESCRHDIRYWVATQRYEDLPLFNSDDRALPPPIQNSGGCKFCYVGTRRIIEPAHIVDEPGVDRESRGKKGQGRRLHLEADGRCREVAKFKE